MDAFLTATYLVTRMPTPVLDNHSPYFCLFRKQPDHSLLKTFGCASFPLLWPHSTHKLFYRGRKSIFLAHAASRKGYRCFDAQTGLIYISRHVVFYENNFPAAILQTNSPSDANSPAATIPTTPTVTLPVATQILEDTFLDSAGPITTGMTSFSILLDSPVLSSSTNTVFAPTSLNNTYHTPDSPSKTTNPSSPFPSQSTQPT